MSFRAELENRLLALLVGWTIALWCLVGGVWAIVSERTSILLNRSVGFAFDGLPAVVYGSGAIGLAIFLNLWFDWCERRLSLRWQNTLRVIAVLGLAVYVVGLVWALWSEAARDLAG